MTRRAGMASVKGRLRREDVAGRRDAVLDAVAAELVAHGYEATTVLGVARRAAASKETIYNWFGSKEGMFAALIERNAERTNMRVREGLARHQEPEVVLVEVATGLLTLLLGEGSLAINRAAMQSPELARLLLERGRFRTGALVEAYLGELIATGMMEVEDHPATLFQMFYGLVIEDRQIRALLGDQPAGLDELRAHAERATGRFMTIAQIHME